MDQIYSFGEWLRVGHGHELQFFALDDEIDRWIAEGLPQEFAPYRLLASDMIEVEHRRYEERLSLIRGEGDKAFEDRKLALMTAAAAEASRQGRIRFTRQPGNAIR